jgi:hypothetical protein
MPAIVRALRLLLKLGWLVPLSWMLGAGASGSIGAVLPIYVFLGFGLATMAIWPVLERWLGVHQGRWLRPFLVIAIAVLSGALAKATALATGVSMPPASLLLNWVLLIGVAFLTLRIQDQDPDYEAVLSDFRVGILGLVVILAAAYTVGSHHASSGPLVYGGAVGYGLLGVFSLAFARRFAVDDPSTDERTQGLQLDWFLSIVILLAALGLIGVLMAQIFAFDIVGAIGQLTQPYRDIAFRVVSFLGQGLAMSLDWLSRLLGLHPSHSKLLTPPSGSTPQHAHSGVKRPHVTHLPPVVILFLKSAVLLLLGTGVLGLLAVGLRSLRSRRPARMMGERRSSAWSWRKMASWLFRHGKEEVAKLVQDHRPRLPHLRRVRSVRDVYRGLLGFGHSHARARSKSETGFEYTSDLALRWRSSQKGLEDLNALYMAERYGSRPPSDEIVKRAQADLEAVKIGAGHSGGD